MSLSSNVLFILKSNKANAAYCSYNAHILIRLSLYRFPSGKGHPDVNPGFLTSRVHLRLDFTELLNFLMTRLSCFSQKSCEIRVLSSNLKHGDATCVNSNTYFNQLNPYIFELSKHY